jgi:hypothetical protein
MEIAVYGTFKILSPTEDQSMDRNLDLDSSWNKDNLNYCNMGGPDASNDTDGYGGGSVDTGTDSSDSDSYEALKFRDTKEAVEQFAETSERLRQSRSTLRRRNHSQNKENHEKAWHNFVVAVTNLVTTTPFPNKSICHCNSLTKLPVVDFTDNTPHSNCRLPVRVLS